MRIISLLYHEVVRSGGFGAPRPSRYILAREDLERHLAAIAQARSTPPSLVLGIDKARSQAPYDTWRSEPFPFLLTFDDANLSAHACIADLLEGYDWRGHFFTIADSIGAPGHLNKEQIRELRKRGHVIGSHSCSHPHQMSRCTWDQLVDEWTRSAKILSDILGEQVTVASVPGGDYSRRVAEAACVAGIKALFNSEPVASCQEVNGCLVLGRYAVHGWTSQATVAGLVAGHVGPRLNQFLSWNVKKAVRHCLGGRLTRESEGIYLHARRVEESLDRMDLREMGPSNAHPRKKLRSNTPCIMTEGSNRWDDFRPCVFELRRPIWDLSARLLSGLYGKVPGLSTKAAKSPQASELLAVHPVPSP
jgi:peptidoglycan/xylan/chitin deacetylase (PgdA/CDA1 family)